MKQDQNLLFVFPKYLRDKFVCVCGGGGRQDHSRCERRYVVLYFTSAP